MITVPTIVPPEINHPEPGGVLLVGRDPGEYEEIEGRPFVGPAGQTLDEALAEAGWPRFEVNIANVVSQRPRGNDFKEHDPTVVAAGVATLHELIGLLKPSLIIALGNEAAYALVPGWPTAGRGIFGAKSINERRGYFWETPFGPVLTTLHPAGVLRKLVPGMWLLEQDFQRARKWQDGMRWEAFPAIQRLSSPFAFYRLMHSQLVAWDIETKWDMTSLLCSGYCGDDLQPYVASYPQQYQLYGRALLASAVPKVGHNRIFDETAMRLYDMALRIGGERHDTQHMWWALEPEIAGSDEAGGEEVEESTKGSRMTRKGLAFLASILYCVKWWKNYPEKGRDDPEAREQMYELNGRDVWVTRRAATDLLARVRAEGVEQQYQQAVTLHPALIEMQLRGLRINEELRAKRHRALFARADAAKGVSAAAALTYIKSRDIHDFYALKKCQCCGGGKTQAQHCWRCGNLPIRPNKRPDWPEGYVDTVRAAFGVPKPTVGDLRAFLKPCAMCEGTGKIRTYDFNPYSEAQLKRFLYDHVGVPKHEWKGKVTTDNMALQKVLRWARGK